MSLDDLRLALRTHQRRLQAGDPLPSLAEVARRAGLSRDTVYAALAGERIEVGTQLRLSRLMRDMAETVRVVGATRLYSVAVGPQGVRLVNGLSRPMLG